MNPRERLIVALDVSGATAAMKLVDTLREDVSFFKVGLQLYIAAGPEIVRAIVATGARVFLDLKLHDIPTTVGKAVAAAGELEVSMLTVHLSGGGEMLRAAKGAASPDLYLLGVTVLTSSTDETLREIGIGLPVGDQVLRLAHLGRKEGIEGYVASPHELEALRAAVGEDATIVTPGVRPSWAGADDQARFMTPRDAIARGADYLVVGRPITSHADPRSAAAKIIQEMNEAPAVA